MRWQHTLEKSLAFRVLNFLKLLKTSGGNAIFIGHSEKADLYAKGIIFGLTTACDLCIRSQRHTTHSDKDIGEASSSNTQSCAHMHAPHKPPGERSIFGKEKGNLLSTKALTHNGPANQCPIAATQEFYQLKRGFREKGCTLRSRSVQKIVDNPFPKRLIVSICNAHSNFISFYKK